MASFNEFLASRRPNLNREQAAIMVAAFASTGQRLKRRLK
jgi:hypothetical protein